MENTQHAPENAYAARISFRKWFVPLVLILAVWGTFLAIVHCSGVARDIKVDAPTNMIKAGE